MIEDWVTGVFIALMAITIGAVILAEIYIKNPRITKCYEMKGTYEHARNGLPKCILEDGRVVVIK